MTTIQQLLENHLPNYYSRDDVARLDDLYRYITDEMTEAEEKEKDLFDADIPEEVFPEYVELKDKLHDEALNNLVNKLCKKQRENCWKATGFDRRFDIMGAEQPKIEEL